MVGPFLFRRIFFPLFRPPENFLQILLLFHGTGTQIHFQVSTQPFSTAAVVVYSFNFLKRTTAVPGITQKVPVVE